MLQREAPMGGAQDKRKRLLAILGRTKLLMKLTLLVMMEWYWY
jgi:hypothetical protein